MLSEAPGDLAILRGAEMASAADVLGQVRIKMQDCPDGDLGQLCPTTLARDVVATADSCHPDGMLVFDAQPVTGQPDHVSATSVGLLAAQTLDLPVLGWTLTETVARQLSREFSDCFTGPQDEQIDLTVTVDRARQRFAGVIAGRAAPGCPQRRLLELLADTQCLRWLRA